jgi:SAM-dependent methyltransferase
MATKPQLDVRYEAPEPPLQLEKVFKFQQRLFGDMSGALVGLAAYLGDRLTLFRTLAEQGPVTAADLARRATTCPEMTAEWLRVMTCAGYLEFEAEGQLYRLPPEYAMALANDGGPMCFAGAIQQIGAFANQLAPLLDAFRDGGGVPQASYPLDLREGMERLSATWIEHELVDNWIAALPDVQDKLRTGAKVADVGCGGGRALIRLAAAFPTSRFVGYDVLPASVERATRNAAAADVGGRVSFEVHDVLKGIAPEFDLVLAFDSLHDLSDPADGLAAITRGLKKDATLLVLELGASGDLLEELGPMGVVHHATRLFYNLPVALASFGHAPPNAGFPENYVRFLCRKAGLLFERSLPVRNPLHRLYVIKSPFAG